MNIKRYCLEYSAVACLFLALGLYRLWPILATPDAALFNFTTNPDGLGPYIHRALLQTILSEQGLFAYLFQENFSYDLFGAEYLPPWRGPTLFWRLSYLPLLFNDALAEHTYEILSLWIYVLTGVGAYFLARVLGAQFWLAVFSGLLFTATDNFNFRLQVGHIALATPFGILLQIGCTILAARTAAPRHYALLGLACWLSFQVNEYYGYYGFLFCAALYYGCLLAFRIGERESWTAYISRHARGLGLALALFTALMFISHASLLLGKLGMSVTGQQSLIVASRDIAELFHYSVKYPLAVFHSLWMDAHALLGNHPVEFSFRLGLALLLVSAILAIALSLAHRPPHRPPHIPLIQSCRLIAVFGCAGLLLALCGLHPDIPASLALPVFKIAPMFRVASRTYMLVNIALLSITLILFIQYFQMTSNRFHARAPRATAFLAGIFLLAWLHADAVDPRLLPDRPAPLPATPALFAAIDPQKPGMVLELPFSSPFDPPEPDYVFFYNWTYHRLPLLNAPQHLLTKTDPHLASQFAAFSKGVNTPVADMINRLGKAGIRYLVVNKASQDSFPPDTAPGLLTLATMDDAVLYEVRSHDPAGDILSLVTGYPADVPASAFRLDRGICTEASLRIIEAPHERMESGKAVTLSVEATNHGPRTWGGDLADVRLGAVWFRAGKRGKRHNPNHGQTWTGFSEPLVRGQSTVVTATLEAPDHPGEYEIWLSLMQPGNTWCFHLDQQPVKIPLTVIAAP